MKTLPSFLIVLFLSVPAFCQSKKTVRINPVKDESTGFLNSEFYKFKTFQPGRVIYKDSTVSTAPLNYNNILGEIHFINTNGDTLKLAHPETMKQIIVGIDTFYYYEGNYASMLTHNPTANLAVKRLLKYIGKEKKGPYGTYSAVASITSYDSYTPDEQITRSISMDENSVFKYINTFYMVDAFHNFFPANKRNFYKLFSRNDQKLKKYLDEHKVNFDHLKDLQELLAFMLKD